MAKRFLNETTLGDKVSFKDPLYGAGHVVGYNKKIAKNLIGYSSINKRKSDAFINKTGNFIQNKDNDYVYSDVAKNYEFYYFADSNLELLNTEEGQNGYRAGDEIEVFCDSMGRPYPRGLSTDTSSARRATIVGFNDLGEPMAYFVPSSLGEIGNPYTTDVDRCVNGRFDNALDTSRRAFANVSAWSFQKIGKTKQPQAEPSYIKEPTIMEKNSEKPTLFEMMKSDATKAAYRVAANQMTTGIKKAILTIMEKKGQSSERIQALSEMLDTQIGQAFISSLIGMGLTYAPVISNDPRAKQLADEFRINGMATAGNAVMDIALEHLMPVIAGALSNLPAPPVAEVRVADTKNRVIESTPVEEVPAVDVKETVTPKAMTVGG